MIQKITTPYGIARIYRKGPADAQRSVLIVPGFSESLSHNSELVGILASAGYDALTFSQPRRQPRSEEGVIERNTSIIRTILDAAVPGNKSVYAVAHSFGSVPLLKAALLDPDHFSQLILMEPSGLSSTQTLPELIQRTGRKIARNTTSTIRDRHLSKLKKLTAPTSHNAKPRSITTRRLVRAQLSSVWVVTKNPHLALREALIAIRYDIADDIKAVRKLGIPVCIVVANEDELFDRKKSQAGLPSGAYHSVADPEAPHDTFWMHPDQTAGLINGFIQQS